MESVPARFQTVPSAWQGAVLICRKCSKKLGGGFGPGQKKSLAKALRKTLHLKKGRKAAIGIVEVGCLSICPKNAVTLIDTNHPERWRIIPKGADVEALAHSLRQSPTP